MENSSGKKHIDVIMKLGFEKAAKSFSQMVNKNISLTHTTITLVQLDENVSPVSHEEGQLFVLTTEVIGEISGRSHLILNKSERDEICKSVSPGRELSIQFEEALLLELDNVISASVIAQLADTLGIEVYGDVPSLQVVESKNLHSFLASKPLQGGPADVFICNTTFIIDNQKHVHPQFLWKLNTKICERIDPVK